MAIARSTSIAAGLVSLGGFGCGSYAVLQLFPEPTGMSGGDASLTPEDAAERPDGADGVDAHVSVDSAGDGFAPSDGPPTLPAPDADAAIKNDANPPTGPLCNPPWPCGPCTSDTGCRNGPFQGLCDPASKRCVQCLSNFDCVDQRCDPVLLQCE